MHCGKQKNLINLFHQSRSKQKNKKSLYLIQSEFNTSKWLFNDSGDGKNELYKQMMVRWPRKQEATTSSGREDRGGPTAGHQPETGPRQQQGYHEADEAYTWVLLASWVPSKALDLICIFFP